MPHLRSHDARARRHQRAILRGYLRLATRRDHALPAPRLAASPRLRDLVPALPLRAVGPVLCRDPPVPPVCGLSEAWAGLGDALHLDPAAPQDAPPEVVPRDIRVCSAPRLLMVH